MGHALWSVISLVILAVLIYFFLNAAVGLAWVIGWVLVALVVFAILAELLNGFWGGGLIVTIIVLAILFEFVL